jgi:hypothetical protein
MEARKVRAQNLQNMKFTEKHENRRRRLHTHIDWPYASSSVSVTLVRSPVPGACRNRCTPGPGLVLRCTRYTRIEHQESQIMLYHHVVRAKACAARTELCCRAFRRVVCSQACAQRKHTDAQIRYTQKQNMTRCAGLAHLATMPWPMLMRW